MAKTSASVLAVVQLKQAPPDPPELTDMLDMEELEELSWCMNASVISMDGLFLIDGLEFTDWPASDAASTLSDTKLRRRGAIVEADSSSCDEDGDRPGASARLPGNLCRVRTSSVVACLCSSVVNLAMGSSDG